MSDEAQALPYLNQLLFSNSHFLPFKSSRNKNSWQLPKPPPKKTKTQNQEKHISWKKGAAILETCGLLISLYSLHSFISSWNTETATDEENYKTASKLKESPYLLRKKALPCLKGLTFCTFCFLHPLLSSWNIEKANDEANHKRTPKTEESYISIE